MNDTQQYLAHLGRVDALAAAALLLAGAISMFFGWRVFKVLVVLNAMVIGVLIGMTLGQWLAEHTGRTNMDVILGIACGLLLAAISWPLMRWAVSILGALLGAFLGLFLWRYTVQLVGHPNLLHLAWVGALVGLITLGLLAFILFRAVVIIFTSFEGAFFALSGIMAMLLKSESVRPRIVASLTKDDFLLPVLVLIPAVIGAIFQQTRLAGKPPAKK